MKYVYLVWMHPFGKKGPTQDKTLLGVHTSMASASDHFDDVVAHRQGYKSYSHTQIHATCDKREMGMWPNIARRLVTVYYKDVDAEPGVDSPSWYSTLERIEIEQRRVSEPLKRKRKNKSCKSR